MASSPWIKHVAAFRKSHPGMDPKKVFGEAAKTFKKSPKQRGGLAALGSSPVSGMHSSGVDLDTQVATQHGGKKSKRRGRGSKRSTKRSAKRSAKRRH